MTAKIVLSCTSFIIYTGVITSTLPNDESYVPILYDELRCAHFCRTFFTTFSTNRDSMAATKIPSWHMANDTEERNLKAKNAYTAMLQVVARQPEDEEYRRFSEEVSLAFAALH